MRKERKHYTAEEKVAILRRHLLDQEPISKLSLKELSALARRVTIGRIERITSYQDAASGRIRSRVEIAESGSILAGAPGAFSFEMIGGTVGDLAQWIAGFQRLAAGDRVALFLLDDTASVLGPTVGLWQGVFFIERDAATGVDFVADHRRRPIAGIRGGALPVEEPGERPPARRMALEDFLRTVSTLRAARR